jgi:hypothetical protein
MSNCCTNIVPLGCFSSCDEIRTGITAPATGSWTARVRFNGVQLEKQFTGTQGDELKVPNGWPEGLVLTMQLVKPDGNALDNNCYSFKNEITVTV